MAQANSMADALGTLREAATLLSGGALGAVAYRLGARHCELPRKSGSIAELKTVMLGAVGVAVIWGALIVNDDFQRLVLLFGVTLLAVMYSVVEAARGRWRMLAAQICWLILVRLAGSALRSSTLLASSGSSTAVLLLAWAGFIGLAGVGFISRNATRVTGDSLHLETVSGDVIAAPFAHHVVAVHEAGHAVVAHALGGRVLGIRTGRSLENSSDGTTLTNYEALHATHGVKHVSWVRGVVAVAGALAGDQPLAGDDKTEAERHAKNLGVRVEDFEKEATRLIDAHLGVIERLTAVLVAATPTFLTCDQLLPYLRDIAPDMTENPSSHVPGGACDTCSLPSPTRSSG